MRQQENQLILQDGEINRRQHVGIHSNLRNECINDSIIGEEMDIETFVTQKETRHKQRSVFYTKMSF